MTMTETADKSSSAEGGHGNQEANLVSLPNKVLNIIFSYLDSPKGKRYLHNIALVCRKFTHVAVSYPRKQWSSVKLFSRDGVEVDQALLWPRFYVSLRHLVFWYCTEEKIKELVDAIAEASSSLSFKEANSPAPQGLKQLNLGFSKLRYLCVYNTNGLQPNIELLLSHCGKHMKALQVRNSDLGDDGIQSVVNRCPSLKYMELYKVKITNNAFDLLGKMNNLTMLYVNKCKVGDEAVVKIAKNMPHLRYLHLKDLKLSDASCAALAQFTNLEWLTLKGFKFSESAVMSLVSKITSNHLPTFEKVSYLEVGFESTPDAIAKFVSLFSHAQMIFLTAAFDSSAIQSIADNCPRLQGLYCSSIDSDEISEDVFIELAKKTPELRGITAYSELDQEELAKYAEHYGKDGVFDPIMNEVNFYWALLD